MISVSYIRGTLACGRSTIAVVLHLHELVVRLLLHTKTVSGWGREFGVPSNTQVALHRIVMVVDLLLREVQLRAIWPKDHAIAQGTVHTSEVVRGLQLSCCP